jgi:hypothetical protein
MIEVLARQVRYAIYETILSNAPYDEDATENLVEDRYKHRYEIESFLQNHFAIRRWEITHPPSGRGQETYLASSAEDTYFVKLGVEVARYRAMSSLGLTPDTILTGKLEDGISIMVQTYITGRHPSWTEFHLHLDRIASVVSSTHNSLKVINSLPKISSDLFVDAGLAAIERVQRKWEEYRSLVPAEAEFVDPALAQLKQDVLGFTGGGLVASHNDICNANWLITPSDKLYLVDLDMMSLDDPAHDLGSLLWWYYPPQLRARFLSLTGYQDDEVLRNRMRVRMAVHCLDIILPRPHSFDTFDAVTFEDQLTDFKAVLDGSENPRGYDD